MRAILRLLILLACVGPLTAQITSVRIAKVTTDAELRLTLEGEDEFLTTDSNISYRVTYNTQGGDRLRIEFWDPNGKLAQGTPSNDPPLPKGAPATYWSMRIAGSPHEFQPGEWQVRTYWNDALVNVTKFRISLPPDSPIKFRTSTVLPSGTIGQPYYLQLTAAGGTPPYRWTAVKAFPAGLTFSPEGVITGTPQERGGFRAVVKAEDSTGNSVTRSLGIRVAPLAEGFKLLSRSLLQATGIDGCSADSVQTEFAAADTAIALSFRLDGQKGRPTAVEWLNPRGESVRRVDARKTLDGPECLVYSLPVAGHPAASDPGEWRVRLLGRGDEEVITLKFTISAQSRVAFLIANRAYQKMPVAGTPDGDVQRIKAALIGDGFRVNEKTNLTLADMTEFERSLGQTVHSGDTVFVYYTGHEIPSGGDAWLAPVNFDPADPRPIQSKAYSVQRLRDIIEDAKAKLQFIVLDASRQGNGNGLDVSAADATTAIAQSAGRHSGGFARALAGILSQPGTDARTALEVDLPKAAATIEPSTPQPVVFIGGAGSFIFRTSAAPRP